MVLVGAIEGIPAETAKMQEMVESSFWQANLRKFADTWTSTGPKSALRDTVDMFLSPVYRRINRNFDRIRNVNTTGSIPLADLTIMDKRFDHRIDKRK
jgi:hypothetical protein